MKISTRGRYGTRAMLDIALQNEKGPCIMKEISRRQDISPKYLDHILSSLRRAGLIKNIRGRNGGYLLARPAAAITVREIVEAVEGTIAPVDCVDNPAGCSRSPDCPTLEVWCKVRSAVAEVLDAITVEDLVEAQKRRAPSALQYMI